MWTFTSPRSIVFGEEALEYLAELEGRRALIISGQTMRRLGIVDRILGLLSEAGIETVVFDQVEPEPCIATVVRAAELARKSNPDWIIGLGGGSSMDAAKAIWALYERDDIELEGISPLEPLGLRQKARLLCIPTTSGSGSDVTWATVITDEKGRVKMEIASKELVPDLVISDPALAALMPPRLAASTGVDALTHAIEAYVAQWRNDFSDAMAIKAIQMVFEYLPRSVQDADDIEAREKMHNAATMAGLAFGNAHVGLAHAIGHALGALFKIDHGAAVGLSLPHVIRFNAEEAAERYAEITDSIGISAEREEAAEVLARAVIDLLVEIDIPCQICETEISWGEYEDALDALVERAIRSTGTMTNPKVPNEEECREIFLLAYGRKR